MSRLFGRVWLLAALYGWFPVWADEVGDQLERARLLREFQETPSPASALGTAKPPSLPAATTEERERQRTTESLRTRQFEDAQWRKLIGSQQMQLHQPATNAAESQWRAQTFERDRQAQDLSADILRRDQEYRSGVRR